MTMCRAHGTYAEAMKKEDGRADFAARKACNYLEDAIEVNVTSLTMDGDSRFGAKECFLKTDYVTISSRTAAAT